MVINLEKVLKIDVKDHVASVSKALCDFELLGVYSNKEDFGDFMQNVPSGAEVVVNYEYQMIGVTNTRVTSGIIGEYHFFQSGVALIPKR